MRNPTGYLEVLGEHARNTGNTGRGQSFGIFAGHHEECDTFTCFHCNRVVFVKPKCDPADLGGLCKGCMKLICANCVGKGNCDPWEEQMKRAEARYLFLCDAGLNG